MLSSDLKSVLLSLSFIPLLTNSAWIGDSNSKRLNLNPVNILPLSWRFNFSPDSESESGDRQIIQNVPTKSINSPKPPPSAWTWSNQNPIDFKNNYKMPTNYKNNYAKNPIIFGDSKPTANPKLNCTPTQTEYDSNCYQVLQQRPCDAGQWLVEEETTLQGKCVENKCSSNINTAFFNGKCININADESCPSGMKAYLLKSGKVECDCKDGFLYNERDGKCYEAYRQGPCQLREYFAIPVETNKYQQISLKPTCLRNPCFIDGYFCNGSSCVSSFSFKSTRPMIPKSPPKDCIKFGSPCTPEGTGNLIIHPETNRPYCQTDSSDLGNNFEGIRTRIIGNVPTLRCAPGSRRDILGNCRAPTNIDFS